MPGGVGTQSIDPKLHSRYLLAAENKMLATENSTLASAEKPMRHVLSNSFGFGGSNCSLVFSRVDANTRVGA